MPRAIWSGNLSFGLVNIPVKVATAVSKKSVSFRELHEEDRGRLSHKRVCTACDAEIPYEKVVRGYEMGPEEYIVLTDEEMEALEPEQSRLIEITDFVDLESIDPVYFDSSYYLVPDPAAAKAYKLLFEVMKDSGKVGVARFVMRRREYLAAIRPHEDALMLHTMVFADEVVSAEAALEGVEVKQRQPTDKEVKAAKQLVEALAGPFEPAKYADDYRERVVALIEKKAQGHKIEAPAKAKGKAKEAKDLLEALEASLAKAKKGAKR